MNIYTYVNLVKYQTEFTEMEDPTLNEDLACCRKERKVYPYISCLFEDEICCSIDRREGHNVYYHYEDEWVIFKRRVLFFPHWFQMANWQKYCNTSTYLAPRTQTTHTFIKYLIFSFPILNLKYDLLAMTCCLTSNSYT